MVRKAKATNGHATQVAIVEPQMPQGRNAAVVIPAPKLVTATIPIVGTAPYVQNKFSQKARNQIMAKQAAGSTSNSKKNREPKDFDALFRGALHVSEEGWYGIPAPCFRNAAIDSCRLVGFKMTLAKLSIFVKADGFDADDGTPLVRLIAGEPEKHEACVRNETGVVDVRVRPMWRKWSANVRLVYDADQFTEQDVANLMLRAGLQVGIGEGRPNSPNSFGQGWGTFTIKEN